MSGTLYSHFILSALHCPQFTIVKAERGKQIHFGSRQIVIPISAQGTSQNFLDMVLEFSVIPEAICLLRFPKCGSLAGFSLVGGSRVQKDAPRNMSVNTTSGTSHLPLSWCGSWRAVKMPRRFCDYICKHGFLRNCARLLREYFGEDFSIGF